VSDDFVVEPGTFDGTFIIDQGGRTQAFDLSSFALPVELGGGGWGFHWQFGMYIRVVDPNDPGYDIECNVAPAQPEFSVRSFVQRDAERFAAALEAELEEPDVGPDARRAERANWMLRFDPEVIAGRYADLIRNVIRESGRSQT
jgi:hypothetical protein